VASRLFCLDFSIPNPDLDMLSLHFSAWRVFTFMNEPFSQEQSPLSPLIMALQQSPFAIAPERQDELKSLIDQYNITAVLKFGDFELAAALVIASRLYLGLSSLEKLWAHCAQGRQQNDRH
jgi:hypothetical protein